MQFNEWLQKYKQNLKNEDLEESKSTISASNNGQKTTPNSKLSGFLNQTRKLYPKIDD